MLSIVVVCVGGESRLVVEVEQFADAPSDDEDGDDGR